MAGAAADVEDVPGVADEQVVDELRRVRRPRAVVARRVAAKLSARSRLSHVRDVIPRPSHGFDGPSAGSACRRRRRELGTVDAAEPGEPWLSYTLAAAITLGVLTRLGWLTRTWLRRMHAPDGPYLPSEARIRDTDLVIALRDPRTIAWATTAATVVCIGIGLTVANIEVRTAGVFEPVRPGLTAFDRSRFLVLAVVIGPLWYRINRDLHAYLAARGEPPRGWPVLSLLAMVLAGFGSTVLQPAWVAAGAALAATSVYRTCERIHRASEVARCRPRATSSGDAARHELTARPLPSSASMVVRFVVFPVALARIQRVINAVWACDGQVLDRPAALEHSPAA